MKYKSELIKEMIDSRGHKKSSIHYQSECIETWIEEAKGAYPKLCDYESEWLNYIVQNPIGEFPYETLSNVTEATVDNVVPYAYGSAILKGQTLVNISTQKSSSTFTFQSAYNGATPNRRAMAVAPVNGYTLTKPNTKYIVKFTVSNYINNYGGSIPMSITDYDIYSTVKTIQVHGNGDYCIIGVTKETLGHEGRILIKSNAESFENNTETEVSLTISNIMVIEYRDGMENWDIPYFEGMQSVKMPVLTTTGKNLFNKNSITVDGYIISNGNLVYQTGDNRNASDYVEVEPNCKYSISGIKNSAINGAKSHQYVGMYDKNKTFISVATIYCLGDKASITTAENTKYIRLSVRNDDLNRLQIEEGATATPYEPHKSNILSTPSDLELRGIGDVKDELNLLAGELTQRIGEIVLDGTQDMRSDRNGVYIQVNDVKRFLDYTGKIACDKLPVMTTYGHLANVENGISGYTNRVDYLGQNWLYVRINNSVNKDEVKEWLTQNPITVQYQLATESIKTVDLTVTEQDGNTETIIRPIEGTMHLSTSGETIKPTFSGEIPVEAITQNLASFIEE